MELLASFSFSHEQFQVIFSFLMHFINTLSNRGKFQVGLLNIDILEMLKAFVCSRKIEK